MSLSALLSETRCRSGEKAISAIAIIEMFIPCACDRGVNSIVHTPECGSRRFFCIDGVHLDCLDHFLLETNKKHTHTDEMSTTSVKCRPI